MSSPTSLRKLASLTLLLLLGLAACSAPGTLNLLPAPATSTSTPTPPPTPTVTPIPLALSVNGEGISVIEFDAELARYQQAQSVLGATPTPDAAKKAVQDDLVDTLLLAQAAAAKGITLTDATVQTHIDNLAAQVGGSNGLSAWETSHGYTDADFRIALRRQLFAAAMRDQITAAVPSTAEQVHVKQILLYNSDAAQLALGYLKTGWNFNDLAARYDPLTKGELGWFPKGYLPDSLIETAVFALQPGQYTDIVQTSAGYDILYLVERDPARPLSPDALLTLQEHAVQDWLTQARNKGTIQITP